MFIVMNSRIILEQGNNLGCMSSMKCGGSQTRVYQAIIESLLWLLCVENNSDWEQEAMFDWMHLHFCWRICYEAVVFTYYNICNSEQILG